MSDPKVTQQEASRGSELLKRVQGLVYAFGYSETDVAYASAMLGGQAVALAAGDSKEVLAQNIKMVQDTLAKHADDCFALQQAQIEPRSKGT